ncbi:hypothetical protein C8R46DRAFT_1027419 [Mycena filopes]|nr:hypothetical protein C8R46DRAFT_1027419 [Mycena filopes]
MENIQLFSLFKATLFVLAGLSHNYGLKPPRAPYSSKDADTRTIYRGPFFEKVVVMWALKSRILLILLSTTSALALIGHTFPGLIHGPVFSTVCPYPSPAITRLGIVTPSFVLAVASMIAGCLLRVRCYSTLGEFFSFRVGISDAHVLITHGPYSVVRHPSYTALFLLLTGTAWVFLGASDNFISACGIMHTNWRFMVYYWAVGLPVTLAGLYPRWSRR